MACALGVAGATLHVDGQTGEIDSLAGQVQSLFNLHKDAVVRVQGKDRHGRLEGTGFYADPSGTIYTLTSVIGDGEMITVFQGDRKFPARLLISDPETGISIVKVDAHTPFLPMGDSSQVEVATPVMAIGYPMGMDESPSLGVVAGFDCEYLGKYFRTTHIRANLPVQRGVGGAPVLNLDGEVVGIIVASFDGNSGCFVLPINAAEKINTDYERFGKLRPGWVGVTVERANDSTLPSSARVAELQPDTPAIKSGLQSGDILLRIGETTIRRPEDVLDASFFLTAGDKTSMAVLRNGEEIVLEFEPAQNPASMRLSEGDTLLPFVESMPPLKLDAR